MRENHIKNIIQLIILISASYIFIGCASLPNSYIPETAGPVNESEVYDGLQATLLSDYVAIAKGESINFDIELKNTTEQGIWIPEKPEIMMSWVYPNGRRDNVLIEFNETRFYSKDELVYLKPQEATVVTVPIKTYYFPRTGITEFQVWCNISKNTNPALPRVWHGQLASNAYGVDILKTDSTAVMSDRAIAAIKVKSR